MNQQQIIIEQEYREFQLQNQGIETYEDQAFNAGWCAAIKNLNQSSKKEQNFKIVQSDDNEVLLVKDFEENDEGEEKFILTITVFIKGCKMSMGVTIDTEQDRDEVFENYGIEDANKIVSYFNTLVS